MLSELRIKSIDDIQTLETPLSHTPSYINALRFCSSDSKEFFEKNNKRIEALYSEKNKTRLRKRSAFILLTFAVLLCLVVFGIPYIQSSYIVPNKSYKQAQELLNSGKYEEAASIFSEIMSFKNSQEMIKECVYQNAIDLFEQGKYYYAFQKFKSISEYSDSMSYMNKCNENYIRLQTTDADCGWGERQVDDTLKKYFSINAIKYTVNGSNVELRFDMDSMKKMKFVFEAKEKFTETIENGNNKIVCSIPLKDIPTGVNYDFWVYYGDARGYYSLHTSSIVNAKDLYGNYIWQKQYN